MHYKKVPDLLEAINFISIYRNNYLRNVLLFAVTDHPLYKYDIQNYWALCILNPLSQCKPLDTLSSNCNVPVFYHHLPIA